MLRLLWRMRSVGPFVLIDGEFIKADTPEELYEKIKDLL